MHPSFHYPRRKFIAVGALATIGAVTRVTSAAETKPNGRSWRSAIIGDTGQGEYGHGLDVLFNGVPNIQVVAVADSDSSGRAGAAHRANAKQQYADYRQMLRVEQPELVVIAPRQTTRHHAMAMAALHSGAHVLLEKPFTTSLTEADEILALAQRSGKKVAVAHQIRLAPSIAFLQRSLQTGIIGEIRQIRAWGKQDNRSGGEDMMVLGTHLFDLIRLLAGDPRWCTAEVLHQGRKITREHARRVQDDIGPVAGDEVEAQFGFDNGVYATFTSRMALRQTLGPWGMELIGTTGAVRVLTEVVPTILMRNRNSKETPTFTDQWERLSGDPTIGQTPEERGFGPANRRLVDDWVNAISQNREPACSATNATKAMEMVMAVYLSALTQSRVTMPLETRTHPLA